MQIKRQFNAWADFSLHKGCKHSRPTSKAVPWFPNWATGGVPALDAEASLLLAQNRPIPAAVRSLLTVLYVRYLPDRFSQQRIRPFRTPFLERYPR
jgi:hypothetical protein